MGVICCGEIEFVVYVIMVCCQFYWVFGGNVDVIGLEGFECCYDVGIGFVGQVDFRIGWIGEGVEVVW